MWSLVATAAAGLNAGAGLASILVEHPAGLETGIGEYWALFPKSANRGMTLSNALSALACGAALGAYFTVPESQRDPAWLTCAIAAASPIPYNIIVLTPTKSVIEEPSSVAKPVAERESWLKSWGWKKLVAVGLAGTTFACMLLVVGTNKEDNLR